MLLLDIMLLVICLWFTYTVGTSLHHWGTIITYKQILKKEPHNMYRDVLAFNGFTFLMFLTWSITQVSKVLGYA